MLTHARKAEARDVRRPNGFTLIEIVVALVVITLLAGVIFTRVIGRVDQGEAAALTQSLDAVSAAVQEFRGDVGRYPGRLTYLSAPLASGALDLCGSAIPNVGKWSGPYLDRLVNANGIPSGNARILNTLRRQAGGGNYNLLLIDAQGVDLSTAEQIDRGFDGDGSFTTGSIRWIANETPDRGRLTLAVPVRGC